MKKLKEKIKKHLKEVLEIKTSPSSIAIGFAIGSFFGIFPTLGVEYLIMFLVILIFKKVSKVAMVAGYVLFNPFITFPIHILSYAIGNYLFSDAPVVFMRFETLGTIITYTRRFIVGSFILATFISTISYFVIYYLTRRYQKG
ncbi:MAG: DUF2062 domain-containing protein [archaeon]